MPYGQEDDDGSLSPAIAKPVQNPVAKPTVAPQQAAAQNNVPKPTAPSGQRKLSPKQSA